MSGKIASLAQEQQKTKPKFEDIIGELIEGERLKNALAFHAYLKGVKMLPRWSATNAWKISYKGKFFLSIRAGVKKSNHEPHIYYGLEPGSWHIGHWLQSFAFPDDLSGEFEDKKSYDEFKEFIWANMQPCKHCMCCAPGHSGIYLGKKFESVCYFRIENPDTEALEFTKRLFEYKRKVWSNKT